jgi:Protein of unknown function (DUF2975)
MNTNEKVSKANRRMNRIQQVSGIFRTLFFAGVVLFIVGVLAQIPIILAHARGAKFEPVITAATQIAGAVLAWFCYKLFSLYSHGELFSSKAVSYIRRIGYTYFLTAAVAFFSQRILFHSGKGDLPPTAYHLDWAFYVWGLASALFPGFLIIFIAWIMDEGRKIREEQELTV